MIFIPLPPQKTWAGVLGQLVGGLLAVGILWLFTAWCA